jgi:predicted dehydrogenase
MTSGTRIGLVGPGRWGQNVLRDLRLLGCDVWAVARSEESVHRAREGGATGVVSEVADLPPVEGAVVCTPITTHGEVIEAVRSVQAIPVFVEKPLTADPVEANGLADRYDGQVFVMDKWRYHPAVAELRRIARSGELGPVRTLHCRRVTRGHRYRDVDTVWVHAPHDLAIAIEVLGELPEAEYAVEERIRGERMGLLACLGENPTVTFEVSCLAPAHRREIRLVCEEGVAYVDGGWAEEVHLIRDLTGDPTPETRLVHGELPLLAELREFVEHLHGGPAPRSSARVGAEVVQRIAELGSLSRRTHTTA